MEELRQKRPRLALALEEYDQLSMRVFQRDSWKCQCCGSAAALQAHHLQYRGRLGSDLLDNLITLCADCHAREHQ